MKHIQLGREGEKLAKQYLLQQKMELLACNYRWRKQEVDLIFKDAESLVIVEVKTRQHESYGSPVQSVSRTKQRHLIKAANAYILENQLDLDVRFDVVSIIHNSYQTHIDHIPNAFYPTL